MHLLLQIPMAGRKRSAPANEETTENFNWVYPFQSDQNYSVTPPFIRVGPGLTVDNLTLQLKIGSGLYFNKKGQLVVAGAEVKGLDPITVADNTIGLKFSDYFFLSGGLLDVPRPNAPIFIQNNKLEVKAGNGVGIQNEQLECTLKFSAPLERTEVNNVEIKAGNGVGNRNNQLECTLDFVPPLRRDGEHVYLDSASRALSLSSVPDDTSETIALSTKTGRHLICKIITTGRLKHFELYNAFDIREAENRDTAGTSSRVDFLPKLELHYDDFERGNSGSDLLVPLTGNLSIGPASVPVLVNILAEDVNSAFAVLSITENLQKVYLILQGAQSWAETFKKIAIVNKPCFFCIS